MNQIEQNTLRFYAWEYTIGRGYNFYPYRVPLEPPYVHYATFNPFPVQEQRIDDGRVPSLFSRAKKLLTSSKDEAPKQEIVIPDVDSYETDLKAVKLRFPSEAEIKANISLELIHSLTYTQSPVSFEIVGTHEQITVQLVTRKNDYQSVIAQWKAFFPTLIIEEVNPWELPFIDEAALAITDFGFENEFMLPINTAHDFNIDPFTSFIGNLDYLQKGETALLQIMFIGNSFPWSKSIMSAVSNGSGGSFFVDAPYIYTEAQDKVSAPLFSTVIRLTSEGQNQERSRHLQRELIKSLVTTSQSQYNKLIPLSNVGYDYDEHKNNVFGRQTNRVGMIMNSHELLSFVHYPNHTIHSEKLFGEVSKSKALQQAHVGSEYILGVNESTTGSRNISLDTQGRLRHLHLIGSTGSGKSNLMKNLIVQDMNNGQSITVLDPHGDLVDDVIGHIPEERLKDVILIDPSDVDHPIGLSLLSAKTESEKLVLSSDLVASFQKRATSWGDQMSSVLGNAIDAFLDSSKGGSLYELRKFLLEDDYRKEFLETVEDESIIYYWEKQFPMQRKGTIPSILTRLDSFLRPKVIRYMMMQKKGIDFAEILNNKTILLVKLSQGLIGEENSSLLGTMIISKINQAAQGRQPLLSEQRTPHYLYIDEFFNFTTPSIAQILSGARKYGLGLVLAHQSIEQVLVRDREVANSILTNPYTRICFRCGDADARKLESSFSFFDAEDIQNLEVGKAIVKIGASSHDGNISTALLEKADEANRQSNLSVVQENTRSKYPSVLPTKQKKKDPTQPKAQKDKPTDRIPVEEIIEPNAVSEQPHVDGQLEQQAQEFKEREKRDYNNRRHRALQTQIKKMA